MVLRDLNMIVVCTSSLLVDHLFICCYMLIAAKSMKDTTTLKAQLSSEFDMKDLGPAKKILGMEIKRDRKSSLLFLSQKKYIEKVLHRFNMHDAKSVSTPIASHFKLSALQCPTSDDDVEYMS